jgi:subtilisin family serine protease
MFIRGGLPDAKTGAEAHGYYVLARNRARYLYRGDDVRNKDLRNYDLSESRIIMNHITFNERTRFPADRSKRPAHGSEHKYQPEYIIERGKNPGLGIRSLHEQGITGKNISVAIIDEPLILDHPEYKGKIVAYKDFTGHPLGTAALLSSAQGPAVASLLAGETVGTAPGVNIYYAAVPAWTAFDASYYAAALDWIVELNETLPEGEKIRAASISINPTNPRPWINVAQYLQSFQKAQEAGILVLDCTREHGVIIGASFYDYENPEDITLSRPVNNLYRIFIAPDHYRAAAGDIYTEAHMDNKLMLRAPALRRTMAEAHDPGEFSYSYDGRGELSWAVPYITGVLAMGWQVRPELDPGEIIKILFDTAHSDENENKYINPPAFINYLLE